MAFGKTIDRHFKVGETEFILVVESLNNGYDSTDSESLVFSLYNHPSTHYWQLCGISVVRYVLGVTFFSCTMAVLFNDVEFSFHFRYQPVSSEIKANISTKQVISTAPFTEI